MTVRELAVALSEHKDDIVVVSPATCRMTYAVEKIIYNATDEVVCIEVTPIEVQ